MLRTMKRVKRTNRAAASAALGIAGLLLAAAVPAPAVASDISVDVRIASDGSRCGEETWIEFTPERSAFVAVYATFSDGSVRPVFPVSRSSHWVQAWEWYSVAVPVPHGMWIESVQAVASPRWFDPEACWLVSAPRSCDRHLNSWRAGCGACGPQVVVTAAVDFPGSVWSFSFAWHGESHRYRVIRTWGWDRHRPYGWVHARWHRDRRHGHGHGWWSHRDSRRDDRDHRDRWTRDDRRDDRDDRTVRLVKDVRTPVRKTVTTKAASRSGRSGDGSPIGPTVKSKGTKDTKSPPSVKGTKRGSASRSDKASKGKGSTASKGSKSSKSTKGSKDGKKKVRG